jgi:hypothetical protein
MKKFFWLTQLMVSFCAVALAQQAAGSSDSAADPRHITGHGPLFASFSGSVRDFNKVGLQWDADSAGEGDYFVVERSSDGVHYETLDALRSATGRSHYELTDIAPPNGVDFYRLKYRAQDGGAIYSKTLQFSLSGDVDFKFYPNPVDKLVIIRTEHVIDIQVIDALGISRLSKRLQSGIQVVNIAFLEKGAYILRVADKESNRIVSNQLIKN